MRRRFTADFKAKVMLDALCGDLTIPETAARSWPMAPLRSDQESRRLNIFHGRWTSDFDTVTPYCAQERIVL